MPKLNGPILLVIAAIAVTLGLNAVMRSGGGSAGDTVAGAGAVGYSRGSPSAPVHVIEFSDFGCPYCGVFARESYPRLHQEYVDAGLVRWTYVPFILGIFPNGHAAALAAECAAAQGESSFWGMHDLLYERMDEWRTPAAGAPVFGGYARALGLDGASFDTCFAQQQPARRIAASNEEARQRGVRSTPTFFVNGRQVQGALPLQQFQMLILEEIARAR
jgi:protein-disulfide isomerase